MSAPLSFPGFKRSYKKGGFFMYPNEVEQYWHQLSGSEQKLLDFILRRTYGFQKLEDRISLSQFVDGVGKFKGAGVSKAQVQRSLRALEDKGFISTERQGYQTRLIKLVLREEANDEPVKEKVAASDQVAYLISLFRTISPHMVDGFMTSKPQVQAMERLLIHYEPKQIEGFIAAAHDALNKQYAPTITSPVELERNLTKLIAYYAKIENEMESRRISVNF